MTVVVCAIWGFQFFLAGLSMKFVGALVVVFAGIALTAYFTLDHVHTRVNQFLASGSDLSYQVRKSLEAFQNGSLFGRGPGEGVVKMNIPDAHTDFIFAVAAEEYGFILCLFIVAVFAIIVIRSMIISLKDNNLFIILSASGLSASFGVQGIINMASTLHLMPTKGMAMPFVSYGGSSVLATALGMGMLLAYSLGLGIPFLLSAVLIDKLKSAFDWIKRHYTVINLVCGWLLVGIGVLMATGLLGRLLTALS